MDQVDAEKVLSPYMNINLLIFITHRNREGRSAQLVKVQWRSNNSTTAPFGSLKYTHITCVPLDL